MDFRDYYQVLGVPRTATAREVKSAYRKLARKYHPDVNPGDDDAETRFREINEAHEVLGDEQNRKKYDQLGAQWKQGAAPGWPPGDGQAANFDPRDFFSQVGGAAPSGRSSFFDMFFGGMGGPGGGGFSGRHRSASRPGSDAEATVEISLEEAFQGTVRQLTTERSGACPTCSGRGRTETGRCPTCQGQGQVAVPRVLEVRIPAGVTDGSRVRVRGEGGAGSGGAPSGDVYLLVRFRKHSVYEAKRHDLHRELRVPLYDAVLGGEATFQGLGGSTLTLKIPPETQSGSKFRLSGQGLPRARGQAGDLYVRLQVEVPTGLTDPERALFQQLAEYDASRSGQV